MKHQPPASLPPQQIFEKLVNKNTIKLIRGDPTSNFVLKALSPQGFWQKFELPPRFSTLVHL
jgi:hypothetical protein